MKMKEVANPQDQGHTPTPCKICERNQNMGTCSHHAVFPISLSTGVEFQVREIKYGGEVIAVSYNEKDAAFIVEAVNSYAQDKATIKALVKMAEMALEIIDTHEIKDIELKNAMMALMVRARMATAQAKGK